MKRNVYFSISFRLACTIFVLMVPIGILINCFSSKNDTTEFIGIAIGGLIIGLLSFLVTYFLAKALITGRLNALAEWAGRLTYGDTDFKAYDKSNDEIGQISLKLEHVREYLAIRSKNALMIAEGDLNTEIKPVSDKDVLSAALNQLRSDMVKLNTESRVLTEAVLDGYLLQKNDPSDFNGCNKEIISNMNNITNHFIRILDSLPFGVAIMDKDHTTRFVNEFNLSRQEKTREEIIGLKFGGGTITDAEQARLIPLQDKQGNTRSYFEICKDTTDLKHGLKALAEWANELADGNMEFKGSSGSNDETGEIGTALERIREYLILQSENVRMIADGNLSNEIKMVSDKDVLSKAVNILKNNILKLNSETKLLNEAALDGALSIRADYNGLNGTYKEIATNINETMDCLVGILDTLPAYIMILDKGFKLKFANEMNMNLIEKTRKEVFDGECYKTFGCDKDTCILKDCVKTNTRQEFIECNEQTKIWYQTQFIPIKDKQGETRSYLEIANEITELKNAEETAVKQLDYQKNEVQKLINNLQNLAGGNLNISSEISEPDADTKEIAELFISLNNSLMESTSFIKSVIDELTGILLKMAEKDISVEIKRDYAGDFKALKDSINYIIEQFNRVFMEINSAAEQVGMGADQVSSSSIMLSQGASEQASSVEEISVTVSTVAEQTKQNAENAKQANELSIKAKEYAQKGNEQMLGMLTAMNVIKESSKNIGSVIKVIDDIAFQTNILALNAAVEAARAGIHGKGFAVVAEEVRNLAARSANAAKETTEMIDNSIKKIEEGYKMANNTAEALKKIVTGVSDAEAKVGLIAEASVQQETAIGQINMGIYEISKVTQANTATAEESASVSEEMAGQAQMLKGMIHEFKLISYDNRLSSRKMELSKLQAPVSDRAQISNLDDYLDDGGFGKY